MRARRLLPYIVGLLALAFALGSLPHGTPGGSLLFQSTWLLYLIYLGPVAMLGIVIALIVIVGMNWRDLGAAIGFGIAQKRRARKKSSRYSFIISLALWSVAIMVLVERPGSIFNPTAKANDTTVTKIIGESTTSSNPFALGGVLPAISNLISTAWFGIALGGLLVVGCLVIVQSLIVAGKEERAMVAREMEYQRNKGLQMVNDALAILDHRSDDPRSRIIACYQNMMIAVSGLGTQVSLDMTARELENRIMAIYALKGNATGELTKLFEEARYSIHDITEEDATKARDCLESIAEELHVPLDAK